MIAANHSWPDVSKRALREASVAVARLEDENRIARDDLDLVLSSKALRLLLGVWHPWWALRAGIAWCSSRSGFDALQSLWQQFRFHRIRLSSVAPYVAQEGARNHQLRTTWIPELRIGGKRCEALTCPANSMFKFKLVANPRARLRAHYALLPRVWEVDPEGVEFWVNVSGESGALWECSIHRTADPSVRWSDRRWRSMALELPSRARGDVTVTLETRASTGTCLSSASVVWGDLILEWPRTGAECRSLLYAAARRLQWSGVRGAFRYAFERERVDDQGAAYARWLEKNQLDRRALDALGTEVSTLPHQPLISIITPVHDTPASTLVKCIESVRQQTYEHWQHCIADDASTSEETRSVLSRYMSESRVSLTKLETRSNISAASDAALRMAVGEYIALLDHDDELAPDALAEVVRHLNVHPDTDIVYSDEDKLDAASGARCEPQFKPDWSPELLLSYNYPCHLLVVRKSLVEEIGGFRTGYEGAQDYDLLLRLTEKTNRVQHIPRVLYHWRKSVQSTASSGASKPWALDAGRRALEDYARRTDTPAEVLSGPYPGVYRLRRSIRGSPLVSVVIPTTGMAHSRSNDVLVRCLRSLRKTTWQNFEVLVAADHGKVGPDGREALAGLRHVVLSYESHVPFNFSHKINWAVRHAEGEHLVLFNDDLEVITPEWLTAMLEYSQERPVGAVGAKLYYPDGRLQHVGILIGVCGLAAHALHQQPGSTIGYAGNAVVTHNCSAVSAACLMTRRSVFSEVGGLDEELPVDFNDVDFCLRLRSAGYRVVFTPYAELFHHESASFGRRRQSSREVARMRERWGPALARDPYYNQNLSTQFSDYRLQV